MFLGNCKSFWEKRTYLFVSILFLALATALGLVYPYMLRILIDDIIVPRTFEDVPIIALTVLGVVILKAGMQFLHGFLEDAWVTSWRTDFVTHVTKSFNFYPSVIMIRPRQVI